MKSSTCEQCGHVTPYRCDTCGEPIREGSVTQSWTYHGIGYHHTSCIQAVIFEAMKKGMKGEA